MKRILTALFALTALTLLLLCLTACGGRSHTHSYGEWRVLTPATCTADGEEIRTCECSAGETRKIPALGHTEITVKGSAPTCTEDGLTDGLTCDRCGVSMLEQAAIPATGHTYYTHTCRDCDSVITVSVGLSFTSNGDGTCYVSGIGECTSLHILIPESYGGMRVTGIGAGAFSGCEGLLAVILPDTVGSVGAGAFSGCTSLKTVSLSGVGTIGKNCFDGCSSLSNVSLSDTLVAIEEGAFANCGSLKSLFLPSTVITVNKDAFSGTLGIEIHTDATTVPSGWTFMNINVVIVIAHTHSYGEWITTREPTCSANGFKVQICECGCKNTAEIDTIPHTEETVSGTPATCTATGLTDGKQCTVCGTVTVEQSVIEKLPHEEETVNGTPATCTATGLTDGKQCTVCGTVTVEQSVIEKLPHEEETVNGTPATCTATGLTDGKQCTVCGTVTLEQETIPTNPHTEETVEGKAPSCTATGLTDGKYCTVCGTVTVEQEEIPTVPHSEETVAGKPATCTEMGLTDGKYCTVCGTVTLEQIEISTSEHDYVDGICTVCGARKTSEGLRFTKNSDESSYTVAGIGSCKDTAIVIPPYLNGLPVTAIAEDAFRGAKITSVFVPETVTNIGRSAFAESTVEEVTLSVGMNGIEEMAFYYCASLESINLPEGLRYVRYSAFEGCTSLKSLYIPASVTYMGYDSFIGCKDLTVYCAAAARPTYWEKDWADGASKVVWGHIPQ